MDTLNIAAPQTMDLLRSRRSAKSGAITGPGPDATELGQILRAAARVPDHGKLAPWRFIVFEGEARAEIGERLAEIVKAEAPADAPVPPERLKRERERFLRAPLVIAVISSLKESPKVPEWEQILSAGAACQNLLLATHTLGYVGTWLTEWCAYSPAVNARLGLTEKERVAGFIYIGKSAIPLTERPRPHVEELTTRYGE